MVVFLLKTLLYSQQPKSIQCQNMFNCSLMGYRPINSLFTSQWKYMVQVKSIYTTRILQTGDLKTKAEMEKAMNDIETLFSTATDEMEYPEESHGSVYYHDDHATAKKAVGECLEAYDTFLKELPSDDMRKEVQGKVGIKLKELKMTFDALPMEDQ